MSTTRSIPLVIDTREGAEVSAAGPLTVGFILVPNFSMIAFSCALEALRMANYVSGSRLYAWLCLSADGGAVRASNNLAIVPDGGIDAARDLDIVLVCGGLGIDRVDCSDLLAWLRMQARRKRKLGGVCTGSYLLARAGVLDGYRCTIHWEHLASLREEFPHLIVSTELFEIDRDRYTCSGGTAPLDMMLHVISRQHSAELALAISEEFICERIRDRHDRQRIPLRLRLGASQPKLTAAVALMEANIEEPMSPDEIARHVGLSRRQLERSFQKFLQRSPTRYYLELRLQRARLLLLQTSLSIVDVALACGFISAPHFSKCYRNLFGLPPRDERRLRPTVTGAWPCGQPVAAGNP
ncbi:MAG: GlxA family transcriptional regulator [Gammaproteobacteria bacterium]